MPVDYSKYPENWFSEIRPKILNRAEHKCEYCKVPDGSVIIRASYRGLRLYIDHTGKIYQESDGSEYVAHSDLLDYSDKTLKIVLTIAHLDQNVENNEEENLKALCQKCHLNHDRYYNRLKFRETINRRKQRIELNFEGYIN